MFCCSCTNRRSLQDVRPLPVAESLGYNTPMQRKTQRTFLFGRSFGQVNTRAVIGSEVMSLQIGTLATLIPFATHLVYKWHSASQRMEWCVVIFSLVQCPSFRVYAVAFVWCKRNNCWTSTIWYRESIDCVWISDSTGVSLRAQALDNDCFVDVSSWSHQCIWNVFFCGAIWFQVGTISLRFSACLIISVKIKLNCQDRGVNWLEIKCR